MLSRYTLPVVALLVFLSPFASLTPTLDAATIVVPDDYPTIQAAIDAATPGDLILISPGTYSGSGNVGLDFHGKALTVAGMTGNPADCIIDCQGADRAFVFHSNEGPTSVIEGLTIHGGYAPADLPDSRYGGAILCRDDSGPTIRNCVLHSNTALRGGAICALQSAVRIVGCTIGTLNWAERGSGVFCDGGQLIIEDCLVDTNSGGVGSGVYANDSSVLLLNSTIIDNWSDNGSGGGINVRGGSSSIINCTIAGNMTTQAEGGGAAFVRCDEVLLLNTVIVQNRASYGHAGGVLLLSCSNVDICNCTIADNAADYYATGLECTSTVAAAVTNSIIWNANDNIYVSNSALTVRYCNVSGSWPGEGNIAVDPRFVDPAASDYHLLPDSPCIDAGDNTSLPLDAFDLDNDGLLCEPVPVDGDGTARHQDDPDTPDTGNGAPPIVDMGAFEKGDAPPEINCAGDLDGDSLVGPNDLSILLSHYGQQDATYSDGDLDCDGDVDLSDLSLLLARYGTTCR